MGLACFCIPIDGSSSYCIQMNMHMMETKTWIAVSSVWFNNLLGLMGEKWSFSYDTQLLEIQDMNCSSGY
jgi:hypothetical protein